MATFTVTNTSGDVAVAGSLAWAVDQANAAAGADTVVFQSGLTGTITLAAGAIAIEEALTITGPGAANLTVAAAADASIFEINLSGAPIFDASISGLTLTGVNDVGGATVGALRGADSNLTLSNLVISNNATTNGAIDVVGDGSLNLTGVVVSNNSVVLPAGAVNVEGDGSLRLSGVTIADNLAPGGGLNYLNDFVGGDVRIENSTISGNGGAGGIGGLAIGGPAGGGSATVLIVNTTIANNTGTGFGGGAFLAGADTVIRNSTIAGNTDLDLAFGADGIVAVDSRLTIQNSIVYSAGGAADLYFETFDAQADYSLIGDYYTCGCVVLVGANTLFGVDPKLGVLADNGGAVWTMPPLAGSPAINGGSIAAIPYTALDALGHARVSGGQIDLGAVEVQLVAPSPGAAPPSQAPAVNGQFANLTRFQTYGSYPPLPTTVTTPEGRVLPNPFLAQQALVESLIAQVDAGRLTLKAAKDLLVDMADGTTSVATLSYQFFTGRLPTKTGLDYLVSSPENPADLNDGYYAGMSLENRYINFAVNLGKSGEGRLAFEAGYGALGLTDAATKAYTEIFGPPAPGKVAEILTPDRVAYFNALGGDALGAKAAMVGWLLAESAKSDAGPYAVMNENFLYDMADGVAAFGADAHIYLDAGPRFVGLAGTAGTL